MTVGVAGRFVVAWSGMRGAVSLAAALALPFTTNAGDPFPSRDLLVFLAFALSLPTLLPRLGVVDGGAGADEELRGRLVATKAALQELDALAAAPWTREQTIERLRAFYGYRKRRFAARAGKIDDEGYEDQTVAYQETLQQLLGAQRDALLMMPSQGGISNEAMNRILRELDLEESRLEI